MWDATQGHSWHKEGSARGARQPLLLMTEELLDEYKVIVQTRPADVTAVSWMFFGFSVQPAGGKTQASSCLDGVVAVDVMEGGGG